MANAKDNRSKDKKTRSWKSRLFGLFINFGLIIIAGIALYVLYVFLQMPSLDSMLHETRKPSITFLDKNGHEIRSMGRIMGEPVSVETLPPHVWQAIISIEDKNFYKHGALSYRGTFRAMFVNFKLDRQTALSRLKFTAKRTKSSAFAVQICNLFFYRHSEP